MQHPEDDTSVVEREGREVRAHVVEVLALGAFQEADDEVGQRRQHAPRPSTLKNQLKSHDLDQRLVSQTP
mgnify:CR=1 FL=1